MPEGDTVWLACQRLHSALAGKRLVGSDFRVPQYASVDFTGVTVDQVVSRGKHQLFRFDNGQTLHTHFRMDGTWHLYSRLRRAESEPARNERFGSPKPIEAVDRREHPAAATPHGGPDHQIRVVLTTANTRAIGYRLPVIELVDTVAEYTVVGHIGPDLLGPDWDMAEALRRLLSEPERTVGEALLDQRNLAGLGTLYRAETLFLTGTHPRRSVADVPDLAKIVDRAQRLLLANREHPEQSTTGDTRRGRDKWVFERHRQPCRRCGTTIQTEEFGPSGQERRSYWCPRCQPPP